MAKNNTYEEAALKPTITTEATPATISTNSVSDKHSQSITSITFADAKLAECVSATAQEQNWTTIGQMTHLNCPNKGIQSIGGIQNLSALIGLNLRRNAIIELAPLSKLTALSKLDLAGNRLVSIEPLSKLTALQTLNLGSSGQLDSRGNRIREVAALAELSQLSELNLSHNEIGDIAPLKSLENLTKLNLNGNQVRDIRPLLDVRAGAEVNLLDNNNIPCAELNELESGLYHGKMVKPVDCIFTLDILISDIRFPDQKLKSCVLDTASSEGWVTINEMTELLCDEQGIVDLTGLQSLKALNHLDLRGNQFIDIAPLFELSATNSIELLGNETVACPRLDALEAELGVGVVSRPGECAPVTLIKDLAFVDPVLEQCVYHSAEQNGWQTIEQMITLGCSTVNGKINDLRGIEQLIALNQVNLAGMLSTEHSAIDITALFALTQQTQVDLSNNSNLNCSELDALSHSLDSKISKPHSCQQ